MGKTYQEYMLEKDRTLMRLAPRSKTLKFTNVSRPSIFLNLFCAIYSSSNNGQQVATFSIVRIELKEISRIRRFWRWFNSGMFSIWLSYNSIFSSLKLYSIPSIFAIRHDLRTKVWGKTQSSCYCQETH